MEIIYTQQALDGLDEALEFIAPKLAELKLLEIRNRILDKADTLLLQPI